MKVMAHEKIVSVLLLLQFCLAVSFVLPSSKSTSRFCSSKCGVGAYSTDATDASFFIENSNVEGSADWELDCYSRPVMVDGKKLWEVLLTDSNGSFRLCERLPSNKYVKHANIHNYTIRYCTFFYPHTHTTLLLAIPSSTSSLNHS